MDIENLEQADSGASRRTGSSPPMVHEHNLTKWRNLAPLEDQRCRATVNTILLLRQKLRSLSFEES